MGLNWSSYYQFAKTTDVGPEAKGWAVTDTNWELTSLLFKKFEQHRHNQSTPMRFPGFNSIDQATPATPLLSQAATGGYLSAGALVGIRLSFVDQYGLETEASPEIVIQTPPMVDRPAAPEVGPAVSTPVPGAIPGGTYVYVMTKRMGAGESAISDVTTLSIPFNADATTSYNVPIVFNPISAYSDGTDSLCIYRSSGYDSNFVLLTTITATPDLQNNTTDYTDSGSILDWTHQPPQAPEFGRSNKVNIDWSNINIPSTAYTFRVYLTQQTGIWGVNNLFQEYPIVNPTTPFPSNVDYLGTETMQKGYPLDFGQLPYGGQAIDLTQEATGAPIYTIPADARGYQTWNFVFPDQNHATPVFGSAYVDRSVGQFKVALSTPNGLNQPALFTTLAGVGQGYAHPSTESGGHAASHIQAASNIGGPTQDLINAIIATPVAGPSQMYRKQATSIYKVTATPGSYQNSSHGVNYYVMPDMDTVAQWPTGITPDFAGQWFEFVFQGAGLFNDDSNSNGQIVNYQLVVNGTVSVLSDNHVVTGALNETTSTYGYAGTASNIPTQANTYHTASIMFATPLTRPNNRFQIAWNVQNTGYVYSFGSQIVGVPPQRRFYIKELF